MTAHVPFEAAYNWCDSNCQRCVLQKECKVALTHDRRRWRREARGQDPDDLQHVVHDVNADLNLAHVALEQVARDRGIDLNAALPSPPHDLNAERLKRAVLKLTRCVCKLEVAGDLDAERAAECLQLCIQLVGKTARVTSYLGREFADVWGCDAVPNLLLIELALSRLRRTIESLSDPQTSSALQDVQRLLAPLLATVDNAAREQLSELVRSGKAPSPFLVR